jgi:hypothetical protein
MNSALMMSCMMANITANNCIRQNNNMILQRRKQEECKLQNESKNIDKKTYSVTRKPYTSEKWRVN